VTAKGKLVAPNKIVFERIVAGPIERVWDHLTRPDLLGGWLAECDFEPHLGGAVRLRFEGKGENGIITQWNPPSLLAYTWNEGAAPSHVVFELQASGNDVMLRLTHERLPQRDLPDFGAGWHAHLDALEAQLETGRRESPAQHLETYHRIRPEYDGFAERPA
jgi:uncharacterized protein YndB with AHSA1/START domain